MKFLIDYFLRWKLSITSARFPWCHQNVFNIPAGSEATITTSYEMKISNFLWLIGDHYIPTLSSHREVFTIHNIDKKYLDLHSSWHSYSSSTQKVKSSPRMPLSKTSFILSPIILVLSRKSSFPISKMKLTLYLSLFFHKKKSMNFRTYYHPGCWRHKLHKNNLLQYWAKLF